MLKKSALCFFLLLVGATSSADQRLEVDLELVLAVDVSRSMNAAEAKLQRDGYVAALSNPAFVNAIEAGMLGRIAVIYVEWAGQFSQLVAVDWQVIDSAEAALGFAKRVGENVAGVGARHVDLRRAGFRRWENTGQRI